MVFETAGVVLIDGADFNAAFAGATDTPSVCAWRARRDDLLQVMSALNPLRDAVSADLQGSASQQ